MMIGVLRWFEAVEDRIKLAWSNRMMMYNDKLDMGVWENRPVL